ncbi:MAG: peptide ABC transporter substrate-binding protein [Chloroflexi bacterium]|nr:peptide ABC transporter substrate-binding protein [Chloroflexota bacterium]
MTLRDKLTVVALVLLLAATSAWAVASEQGRPPTVPAVGGSYVEGVVGGRRHLNPILATTAVDQDVARLVFTGLMRADRSGEIVPDLASAVRVSADGKEWTFEIRDDARWHDGKPVIADDVVYTVGLFQDRAYRGPYAEAFRGVVAERVGSKVVRFTLPGPYGPFTANTTFPLLPSHLLGAVGYLALPGDQFDSSPVGTGPFKFAEADDREIHLTANLDFYRTRPERSRPYLDRIVLRSFDDSAQALSALARGELDGVAGVSSIDAERARALRNLAVYSYPSQDFTALFLNVRPEKAAFRERAVRQAIATAIDRGRILDVAIDGRGRVADTFVPPSSWAYPTEIQRYVYNPASANAILDAAGWKDSNSDGIRDKAGVTLRFTIATSQEPPRLNAASEIVSDLLRVGIAAELRAVPFDELLDTVARPRDFDALLVGITSAADPDPYPFFHSSQTRDPGYNFSGYSTLPMDRNLEAARRTADREGRRALYEPVFQTIATEVPVLFLYFADYLYAQLVTVRGVKISQIVEPSQRFWDVEDWYVKSAPRR